MHSQKLHILNIPESLVIVGKPKSLYRIGKLYYSSTAPEPGDAQSQIDAFRYLQSSFADVDCSSSPDRLYISRQDKFFHKMQTLCTWDVYYRTRSN